ncbi:MAG: 2-C-methyl-D-erythritol 2,4-cyclodiphosphate synthase [Lachnospiraceae bacterium]|nr:2-C-methyl-D-erythritol 2,4-cyclodiphosphate synthase [Lachnospiraceae bacterium]
MIRIGNGYDVHKLVEKRALILGGVNIPFELGLLGHSDADVLTHAIMDALLGAAALRDIGYHFPDNDPKYEGVDSLKLLAEVDKLIRDKGFKVGNIDATIMAEKPKLKNYIDDMRENIANVLNIDLDCVSVKATTEEGLGFTGRMEGIAVSAVCILESM